MSIKEALLELLMGRRSYRTVCGDFSQEF